MLTDGNFTPADADYIYLICEAKQPFLHSHLILAKYTYFS